MATISSSSSSPISFSGLATGMDTSSIVSQLVAIESTGLNQMQAHKSNLQNEQAAYTTLGQKLQTLESAAAALSDPTTFEAVAATSSSPTAMSASATGALQASYNVTILNRSSASRLTSGAVISNGSGIDVTAALNGNSGLATALTSTAGSFTINGTSISYDASKDTMKQLLARINSSSAGVNAMYDKLSDKIILTNRVNGASAVNVSDVSGNLAAALNLTVSGSANDGVTVLGKNAQITIDGLNNGNPIQSKDDIFTEAETGVTGLTLTLNQDSGNALVSVGTDTTTIASQFTTFVNAYNDVQDYITKQTAVTGTGNNQTVGILGHDINVKDLAAQLRSMLGATVGGLPSGLNYLAGLGVGTTGKSADISVFDSAKLSTQLSTNINDIKSLLTDPVNGIMTKFDNFVQTQAINPTGLIQSATDSINQQSTLLSSSISQEQNRINAYQTQLQASFAAMETAVSAYQGGLNQLLSAVGQLSVSSSNGSSSSGI